MLRRKGVRIVNETGMPQDFIVYDGETGERIHRVRAISLHAVAGEPPIASIAINLPEVDIAIEADIHESNAEIERLRTLLTDARASLAFVRTWSEEPALLAHTAPPSRLLDHFWAWAEGWDCDLELRIAAALDPPEE